MRRLVDSVYTFKIELINILGSNGICCSSSLWQQLMCSRLLVFPGAIYVTQSCKPVLERVLENSYVDEVAADVGYKNKQSPTSS